MYISKRRRFEVPTNTSIFFYSFLITFVSILPEG
uniref:Uncharacterized protein n=1 Tax=Lepeophtheirus salmonis TaxID=72036 RepID=A0A0K2V537_LEPSM